MLSSIRNEYLKLGYLEHDICNGDKASYFSEQIRTGICDYYSWLEGVNQLIPKEDIIVRTYDRTTLINNDIVDDFLSTIGLKSDEQVIRQLHDANPAVKNTSLESLLLSLGNLMDSTPHRARMRLYKQLAVVAASVKPSNNQTTHENKRALQLSASMFAEDNEKLRQKYLPHLDETFTSKPIKEAKFETPNDALENNLYAHLIADMWAKSEDEYCHLLKENTTLWNALLTLAKNDSTATNDINRSFNDEEREELYFKKNLSAIQYKLHINQSKNVALFGYNDISVSLCQYLDTKQHNIMFFIDNKASWQDLTGTNAPCKAYSLNSADLSDIDTVILCTEASQDSMQRDLSSKGFKGMVISYTD